MAHREGAAAAAIIMNSFSGNHIHLKCISIVGACLTAVHGVAVLFVTIAILLSLCEQAEKLAVLDHAFTVTSMSASIWQLPC